MTGTRGGIFSGNPELVTLISVATYSALINEIISGAEKIVPRARRAPCHTSGLPTSPNKEARRKNKMGFFSARACLTQVGTSFIQFIFFQFWVS